MSFNTNGVVRRAQVVVGQATDPTDFMALSGWSRAYINDLVVGAFMRTRKSRVGPDDDSALWTRGTIYAVGHAGAPRNNAVARRFGCNPGAIFYVPTGVSVDGVTPKVLTYYLQQDEINGSLTGGDATNPRFDAVYVRVSEVSAPTVTRNFEDAAGNKTSQPIVPDLRTKVEWTIVAGTPAVHPQIPAAPDSTWAYWGVWYVPKAFNSTFNITNIFDYRIPCEQYTRHVRDVKQAYAVTSGTATCTLNGYDGFIGFTDTTTHAWVSASCPTNAGRLMGFSWTPLAHSASSIQRLMVRAGITTSGGSAPSNLPWTNTVYGGLNAGDPTIPANDLDNYSMSGGTWYNGAGSVVTTTVSGLALLPVWANGYGSTAEDAGQAGGQGLLGGTSWGDYSHLQGLWIPAAITDKLITCVFDVAG